MTYHCLVSQTAILCSQTPCFLKTKPRKGRGLHFGFVSTVGPKGADTGTEHMDSCLIHPPSCAFVLKERNIQRHYRSGVLIRLGGAGQEPIWAMAVMAYIKCD